VTETVIDIKFLTPSFSMEGNKDLLGLCDHLAGTHLLRRHQVQSKIIGIASAATLKYTKHIK
jgi:hypothetical protein